MNWVILIIGGFFEVGFTYSLGRAKAASGNNAYLWYGVFVMCLLISIYMLMKATQTLPLGTAYAVWTGIGAMGTVLLGILVFNEPATLMRIFFIVTLIGSIIGLKAVSPH